MMVGQLVRIMEDGLGNLYSAHQANMGEIPVPTKESNLAFDADTKVIYYNFDSYKDKQGYMAPYISENGKYCRYNGALGRIVEIG